MAEDAAPKRTWTGDRWSAMTGELITVVCREGDAAMTPMETQFLWGWRRSNHLTTAFDGDVYVVTPQGWASLLGEWCGAVPALPASAAPLSADPAVQDAERILAEAYLAMLGARAGECLLCYVQRMLGEFGCNTQLTFAMHYRDLQAPRATGLERRLGQVGGYCDCQIFLNGYELDVAYLVPDYGAQQSAIIDDGEEGDLTWPLPLPYCTGVRVGSTQPCLMWRRRRRRW